MTKINPITVFIRSMISEALLTSYIWTVWEVPGDWEFFTKSDFGWYYLGLGQECHDGHLKAGLGWWLDLIILEVFSSLNDSMFEVRLLQAEAIFLGAATVWPRHPLDAFSFNCTGKVGGRGGWWGRQVVGPEISLFPCYYRGLAESAE